MTKPKRIFVDLDDVLNQFTLHALQYVGCPIGPWDYHLFKPKWGFDIVAAANGLHHTKTFTAESFWGSIEREVWSSAPLADGACDLLNMCVKCVGGDNVFILSSPTRDPECLAGKLEWIHANMPPWIQRQFLFGSCKHVCAGPRALLIDDCNENVDKFREHGGHAILVPRPWNSDARETGRSCEWVEGWVSQIFYGE